MMKLAEWGIQLTIWGWAVDGFDELAVYTSENTEMGAQYGWWDGNAASLDGQLISHDDEPYHRPDDYWALPGVTELLMRQHCAPLFPLRQKLDRLVEIGEAVV